MIRKADGDSTPLGQRHLSVLPVVYRMWASLRLGHLREHVMVADVIKSFDTVDRSILDCALGRLGLPDWFRKVYFSFHSQVRLRF